MWEAGLIFVVKKQFVFLRGTYSTIMPPQIIKTDFFVQNVVFRDKKRKKKYTQQGRAEVPLPRSLEISSCRCILNTAQPACLHLLPPNEEEPNESLWKDLHISPNFWKIKWTRYYNVSILIFFRAENLHIPKI